MVCMWAVGGAPVIPPLHGVVHSGTCSALMLASTRRARSELGVLATGSPACEAPAAAPSADCCNTQACTERKMHPNPGQMGSKCKRYQVSLRHQCHGPAAGGESPRQLVPVALRSQPPVLPAAMPLASPRGQPAAQLLLVRQRHTRVHWCGVAAALLQWARGWRVPQLRRPREHQLRQWLAPLLLLLCTDMKLECYKRSQP